LFQTAYANKTGCLIEYGNPWRIDLILTMYGCGNQIALFQCQIPLLWIPYFLFENNEGYFVKSSKIIWG